MEFVAKIVGPDNGDPSALQLAMRVIVLFIFGIAAIRIAGRRTFSQYSPLDIIVAIVIGSNVSRVMTGKASFVAGCEATLLLALLHRVVAMAALRWPALAALVKGHAVELVRDGVVDEDRLRACEVSRSDLAEALRIGNAAGPAEVALAVLESGGRISVVKKPSRD